jgi:hypothetical protein
MLLSYNPDRTIAVLTGFVRKHVKHQSRRPFFLAAVPALANYSPTPLLL